MSWRIKQKTLVATTALWVDANFKEPQLANMRVGQPVTLTADLYGGSFRYHGKVANGKQNR